MPRVNAPGPRSKYWCGTWNHAGPKEADIDASADILSNSPWFVKMYASQERGASGTLHLQIYGETKYRKYHSEMREQFPGIHWETRKGKESQAREYALGKDRHGNAKAGWIKVVIDKGEHSDNYQGKRSDLEEIRDLLKNGDVSTVKDAMDEVKSMQGLAFAKEWIASHAPPPRTAPPKVFWLYGTTGTGKTRAVYDFASASSLELWRMPSSGSYFQGYIGQQIALFDDFRAGRLPFTELLELTDRYAPIANVKYGQCWFMPDWIIFTSAKSIAETFAGESEDLGQLVRRIREGGGAELDFTNGGGDDWKQRIDVFLASHP